MNIIDDGHPHYPALLKERLGAEAPETIWAKGPLSFLRLEKTALYCSRKCPGDAILEAMDQALRWRESGRCIISGFHSPIEKECLHILLKGLQPVIVCPARSIASMRIPKTLSQAITSGRLLLLSFFGPMHKRITARNSEKRNLIVAALADHAYFAHIAPRGKTAQLADRIREWDIPFRAS